MNTRKCTNCGRRMNLFAEHKGDSVWTCTCRTIEVTKDGVVVNRMHETLVTSIDPSVINWGYIDATKLRVLRNLELECMLGLDEEQHDKRTNNAAYKYHTALQTAALRRRQLLDEIARENDAQ